MRTLIFMGMILVTLSYDAETVNIESLDAEPWLIRAFAFLSIIFVPAMIHKAKDLSPDQRAAIESLLGRHILADEVISVRAIEPPALSDERKQELLGQLKKYFAEVDARRTPGSPEEAEDVMNEAMRSVRPHYRPHR